MKSNHCNSILRRRFLAGELSSAEEASLIQHLNDCDTCALMLESESSDEWTQNAVRKWLSPSSELIATKSSQVLSTTSHWASIDGPQRFRGADVDLSFLSPTDDPVYMGRIGSNEIIGIVGQGGMGVVLKALDPLLSRNVAIKILSPVLAGIGAARLRFAREARAMAALSHENIVPIYAVDEHQGLPYFAMEYVAGGTLEHRLHDAGPMDSVAIVRVAMQIARALTAAHDSGLVHRDIKPGNILLDKGTERVRVTDFGLATVANEASFTKTGVLAGTPLFMSPEQVRGEACDARSDLFGLGCVMYAMATGHSPFRAESVYSVLHRIVHDSPRSIRLQNPEIPDWLASFTQKLLEKNANVRFQSASEVAALLETELSFLQSPTLSATPSRHWQKSPGPANPWIARHWKLSLLVAVATLVLVTAVPFVAVQRDTQAFSTSSDQQSFTSGIPSRPVQLDANGSQGTPLLWDLDGTLQLKQRIDRVTNELLGDPIDLQNDPWNRQVHELTQEMEALFRE